MKWVGVIGIGFSVGWLLVEATKGGDAGRVAVGAIIGFVAIWIAMLNDK